LLEQFYLRTAEPWIRYDMLTEQPSASSRGVFNLSTGSRLLFPSFRRNPGGSGSWTENEPGCRRSPAWRTFTSPEGEGINYPR